MLDILVNEKGEKISLFGKLIFSMLILILVLLVYACVDSINGTFAASEEKILEVSKNACVKESILSTDSKNGRLKNNEIKEFIRACDLKAEHEKQLKLIK